MIQDEIDWLYHNRDRVGDADWWSWVDQQTDADIVRLGEFWLRNLSSQNTAGHAWYLVSGITHHYHQYQGLSPRQRRAVCASVREHWLDLRPGVLA